MYDLSSPQELIKIMQDGDMTRNIMIKTLKLALDELEQPLCPKYNEAVLPDENGMCSLCGSHEA